MACFIVPILSEDQLYNTPLIYLNISYCIKHFKAGLKEGASVNGKTN